MGKKNKNKKRKRSVPDSNSAVVNDNDDDTHQESIPLNEGPLVASSTGSTKDAQATTTTPSVMDPTKQTKKKKRKRKKHKIEAGSPVKPKETTAEHVEEAASIVPESKFGVVLRRLVIVVVCGP